MRSKSWRDVGAWAEAIARDRWRVFKCKERLRVVNLGATAIGTGVAAPRDYIFRVVGALRDAAQIGERVADFEPLIETRPADHLVGQAEGDEALLEFAHLERGAHQYGDLVERLALALQLVAAALLARRR